MFRRLANRLTFAAVPSDDDDKVRQLEQMGFPADAARRALSQCDGNVERATEILLTSTSTYTNTDQAFQAAMTESLQSEDQRIFQLAQQQSLHPQQQTTAAQDFHVHDTGIQRNPAPRPATTHRVAAAAQQRASQHGSHSNSLSFHHPMVSIPKSLDSKTKGEQILRSVDRLKSHSLAIDTLHKALVTIQANPNVEKYRSIDTNNPGYQRSVAGAPGSDVFLTSMGFQQRGETLIIPSEHLDSTVLYLGISALEQVKLKDEYKQHKDLLKFEKDVAEILRKSDSCTEEAITRSKYMHQLPSEPTAGMGALVQIKITTSSTFKRRFDGDDTLRDILNWLGGHAPGILVNLDSQQWSLVDLNQYPATPIDISMKDMTLLSIGCWPSGKLEIVPSTIK